MASYRDFLPVSGGATPWVRPSDWLAMPTVTAAEQKFVGLHGVWEDGDNVVAFLFAGNYTVDWGDGNVENMASGVKAEHQYVWGDIPAGTTTSQGYRQVMITVTPNGGNLTSCNFQQRFTARNQIYSTGFLDVTLSMPNASSGASIVFGGATVGHSNVERATVLTIGGATNMTNMFNGCYSMQSVPLFNTASVTNMQGMFQNCISLQSVPLFNTASVWNMQDMFRSCFSLQSVPLLNTASVSNMSGMFNSCNYLQSVPLFNTASVLNMVIMFQGCYSLQSVPLFNTASVTAMNSMFFDCRSLQSVPLFNTASVTNMGSMFGGCSSLQSVPLFNTASVTNMSFMFQNCSSLQSVPLFNTASVLNMGTMFQGCVSLQNIPALSTAGITTTAGTDYGVNFANNARTLARCEMVFARTVGFPSAGLGAPALVEIFTNLVDRSATTSATITITGNWGAALLTAGERAIALNKNWLITG